MQYSFPRTRATRLSENSITEPDQHGPYSFRFPDFPPSDLSHAQNGSVPCVGAFQLLPTRIEHNYNPQPTRYSTPPINRWSFMRIQISTHILNRRMNIAAHYWASTPNCSLLPPSPKETNILPKRHQRTIISALHSANAIIFHSSTHQHFPCFNSSHWSYLVESSNQALVLSVLQPHWDMRFALYISQNAHSCLLSARSPNVNRRRTDLILRPRTVSNPLCSRYCSTSSVLSLLC